MTEIYMLEKEGREPERIVRNIMEEPSGMFQQSVSKAVFSYKDNSYGNEKMDQMKVKVVYEGLSNCSDE
jgi:hypothetical protein